MRLHWAWRAIDRGAPDRQAPVPGTVRNPVVDSELPNKFLNIIEFPADTTRSKLETNNLLKRCLVLSASVSSLSVGE